MFLKHYHLDKVPQVLPLPLSTFIRLCRLHHYIKFLASDVFERATRFSERRGKSSNSGAFGCGLNSENGRLALPISEKEPNDGEDVVRRARSMNTGG